MSSVQKQEIIEFFTRNYIAEDISWVLAGDLEPYAYTQLPSLHSQKPLLYPAYLASVARHQLIKAELYDLLKTWYGRGFEVMLYKGFYLNQWVYEQSGQRMYIDVDIVVHEAQWLEMSKLAQNLGWECSYRVDDDVRSHHEIAHLYSPIHHFKIDIHRSFIHQRGKKNLHEELNKEVWDLAQQIPWNDIYVLALSPLDCVLCGLVAHRLWSGGKGKILLKDYLDFKVLIDKFGFTEEELLSRSSVLGIYKTLTLFLEFCNPFKNHFVSSSTQIDLRQRHLQITDESGPISHQGPSLKVLLVLKRLVDMAYYSPSCIKTLFMSGLTRDMRQLVKKLMPSSEIKPVSLGVISRDTNKAVEYLFKWCSQEEKRNSLYALTLFAIYRHLGQPVCFVQGIDSSGKKHTWVELAGIPISGANDRYARRKYSIEYQFPAKN